MATADLSALNQQIADDQLNGGDKLEYAGGQIRDPQVEALIVGRSLPWWSETRFNTGQIVKADGLMTAADLMEKLPLLGSPLGFQNVYAGRRGQQVPQKRAVVRELDGKVVGCVGMGYRIVQPQEAFDWADSLVDSGAAKYETAGLLHQGSVAFISMEIGHLDIKVNGVDDPIDFYLMVRNSYDGGSSLTAVITPVRVVCTNTDRMARLKAISQFSIRHSARIDGKLAAARQALGIEFRYEADWAVTAQKLADTRLVDEQVKEIFRTAIWPLPDDISETRELNHPSTAAYELYLSSPSIASIAGTAWGAYNAVTEFIDHVKPYDKARVNSPEDRRLDTITLGSGQDRKDVALAALLKA